VRYPFLKHLPIRLYLKHLSTLSSLDPLDHAHSLRKGVCEALHPSYTGLWPAYLTSRALPPILFLTHFVVIATPSPFSKLCPISSSVILLVKRLIFKPQLPTLMMETVSCVSSCQRDLGPCRLFDDLHVLSSRRCCPCGSTTCLDVGGCGQV
jgi:hypothetical protein